MAIQSGYPRAAIYNGGQKCFGIQNDFIPGEILHDNYCYKVCSTGTYGCGTATTFFLIDLPLFTPYSPESSAIITVET